MTDSNYISVLAFVPYSRVVIVVVVLVVMKGEGFVAPASEKCTTQTFLLTNVHSFCIVEKLIELTISHVCSKTTFILIIANIS